MLIDDIWSWYAAAPARYWATAVPFAVLLFAAAFRPRTFPAWSFAVIVAACLAAFRWPLALYGSELNADESQLIAGAITLKSHPVFWKYVDAHACGPLDIYPLTILGWLGVPLNFVTARVFGQAMDFVSLLGIYALLRDSYGELVARTAVLVPVVYLSLMRYWDLVHYSSETVPMALLALGMAGMWIGARRGAAGTLFAGGAAMGAVPWGKIQALPTALAFGACATLLLWKSWAADGSRRRSLVVALVAGCSCASLLFAAMLTFNGLWAEWSASYIRAGLDYASTTLYPPLQTVAFFLGASKLGYWSYGLPLLAAVGTLFGAVMFHSKGGRRLPIALGVAVAMAFLAVATPGRMFPHYLALLTIPLAAFAGALVGAFLEGDVAGNRLARRAWLVPATLGAFLCLTLGPQVYFTFTPNAPRYSFPPGTQRLVKGPAAEFIGQLVSKGDSMAIWGWEPQLYVQTGLGQATREAHTERQIMPYRMQPFYRARYLADLQRNRPRIFVDAVGPDNFAFTERSETGHETWPELRQFIAANYKLVGDVDSYRVYRSNP